MVTRKYSLVLVPLLCGFILLNLSPVNGAADTKGRRRKPKPKPTRQNSISPECSKSMIDYAPVCGSDGKAYININWLKCIQSGTPSSDLHQVDESNCKDWAEVTKNMKKALDELEKIKTELSRKRYPLKKKKGRRLWKREGCKVTYNFQPTCGSDGNMYPNPSYLRCAKKKNPDLHAVYRSNCGKKPKINLDTNNSLPETESPESDVPDESEQF